MSGWSLRHRLAAWYLAVLVLALATLAGTSWWLFGRAVSTAADASLRDRIARARGFIEAAQRHVVPTELYDELHEFGQLSEGEALIEVRAGDRVVYRPPAEAWPAVSIDPPGGDAVIFADRESSGRPFRVAAATFTTDGRTYHVVAALPLAAARAARREFGWLLAIVLPALGLAAAAGGYWISGRALAPVDRMTRDVRGISLHNLDRRIDVPSADDEIRRLALTFNDMLGRLQASVADMVRFTAEAAHELRTPVTLIRTTADLALTRPRTPEEYHAALADVLVQAERMSHLVGDLLALARVDAGVEPLDTSMIDVRAVVDEVAHDISHVLEKRGLRLDIEMPDAVSAQGAKESLRRLLLILLDNATKYTPAGGGICLTISLGPPPAPVTIQVIDTGPGIDPAEQPFVFDRFYRGVAARADTEGSGLGLSLARAIVDHYGGAIRVGNAPNGRGCRVEVEWPSSAENARPRSRV